MRDLTYEHLHAFEGDDHEHAMVLAERLQPALGTSDWINASCVMLVEAAREWACLQVHKLNEGRLDLELVEREQDLERAMDVAAGRLPETDDGPIKLDLDYDDVRGVKVRLVLPGEWAKLHTTWAGDGMAVES